MSSSYIVLYEVVKVAVDKENGGQYACMLNDDMKINLGQKKSPTSFERPN